MLAKNLANRRSALCIYLKSQDGGSSTGWRGFGQCTAFTVA
ncbi:hypothetical protein HMPREF0388_0653 [Mobiluncus curtisii ATCC 51333]|uniref:Uncharacterized protein n=1 Tax=Mobiluncus curtisii ATCC 51333 TaxID=887326 RepID=E6LXR6_9ACTO|nr:hypothetical protein HMPREF0388_0653 [Mobiluncus curtisii ATCC 51333]